MDKDVAHLIADAAKGPISDREQSSYKDAPGIDLKPHQDASEKAMPAGDRERFDDIFRSMVPRKK